jgi:hypothetical protein
LRKVNIQYDPKRAESSYNPGEDFSLPNLQECELRSVCGSIHNRELSNLLEGSGNLKQLVLVSRGIAEFRQAEFVDMLQRKRVLRCLETLEIAFLERQVPAMTERFLLELMNLPNIKVINNALWCKMDKNGRERVMTLAREKKMEVEFAYRTGQSLKWVDKDNNAIFYCLSA